MDLLLTIFGWGNRFIYLILIRSVIIFSIQLIFLAVSIINLCLLV